MKTTYLFLLTLMFFSGTLLRAQDAQPAPAAQQVPRVPAVGTDAPDFALKVVGGRNGQTLQLSSLKGKAVIVSFWATWCEPCKMEMPWLVELQKKYAAEGLQVVGVAMDDAPEKEITDFARKMGVNYPVLQGTEKVADLYGGVDALPMTFWVDRSGKIIDTVVGLESESLMETSIKKSLGIEGSTPVSAK
jgi:cytochrome c biogenesis protein CcmG/thiol:disulfide interchange protein DsbE